MLRLIRRLSFPFVQFSLITYLFPPLICSFNLLSFDDVTWQRAHHLVVVVLQLKVTFLVVPFTFRRESCKMDQPFVKTYATLGYLWWRDGSLSHSAPRTILSLSHSGERERKKREKEENLTIKWSCCNPPQKKKMLRKCLVSMPSNVLFPPSFREIRKQKKNLLSVLVVENIGDHWRPVLWHRGENLRQSKSEPNKIWGDFSHSRSGRQSIGSEQNEQPGVRDVWSDRYIALFKAFCIHPDGYSPNPMANWKEKKKKGKKKKKKSFFVNIQISEQISSSINVMAILRVCVLFGFYSNRALSPFVDTLFYSACFRVTRVRFGVVCSF